MEALLDVGDCGSLGEGGKKRKKGERREKEKKGGIPHHPYTVKSTSATLLDLEAHTPYWYANLCTVFLLRTRTYLVFD